MALLPLAVAWLAAGMFCASIQPSPDPQTTLLLSAAKEPRVVEGEVIRTSPARLIDSTAPFSSKITHEQSQMFDLRVHSVAGANTPGGLRLTLYASVGSAMPRVACGDSLRVITALHPPERYNDPGVWDASDYLLRQGIGVLASAKASEVTLIRGPRHPTLPCRLHALQQAASARILDYSAQQSARLPAFLRLGADDTAMLAAMIAGDRTWLQRHVRVGFERTGSFHLLVVSGLHLAIFAGLIFWIASRIRLNRLWASLLTIIAALAYAVFTGFGQPVQRSFWMVTLYLLGRLLWRERSALNAIGFAALWLLAANPRSLFDAGFQMTLFSVIAIAGIAAPVAERTFAPYLRATRNLSLLAIDASLSPQVAQFRVSLRLLGQHLQPLTGRRLAWFAPAFGIRLMIQACELLLVSITVELVMSLPMAVYFHRVTVLALPVNFLIVPFLGLLLPSAILTFAALLVSAKLAALPAMFTAALLHTVTVLIQTFAGFHAADLRLPAPSTFAVFSFAALFAFAIWIVRQRRCAIPGAFTCLFLAATCAMLPRPIQHRKNALEITAIDVGQGDSLLLITPDGKTLLIDAGGSLFGGPAGVSNFDMGEDVVSPALWSRGIRRLDAVALTHAHLDHIGGMPAVLANFHPREIWVGNNPHSGPYYAFLAEATSIGAIVRHRSAGDEFPFGSASIRVLAPAPDYHPGPTPTNNDSLVLHVNYGHTSALLEGDAEAPSEERMLISGHLHSDLLKVGHHGSRTSTLPPFLAAVGPSFAAVSVGRRNLYGHPRIEVLDELQATHIRTYRTDMLGAATFYLDGTHVTAATFDARTR